MKISDIQNKIEALRAEQKAMEELASVYPSDLPEPDFIVWYNSKLSEFGLIFKINTLDEAIETIGKLWNHSQVEILPLRLSRGTFTSFKTPAHEPDRGEKTSEAVFPVIVNVSHWGVKFRFYALIDGHLIKLEVELEHNSGFQRYASVRFLTRTGRETSRTDKSITILLTPAFTGYQRIKWESGSGDYPNEFTLYWTEADSILDFFTDEALS